MKSRTIRQIKTIKRYADGMNSAAFRKPEASGMKNTRKSGQKRTCFGAKFNPINNLIMSAPDTFPGHDRTRPQARSKTGKNRKRRRINFDSSMICNFRRPLKSSEKPERCGNGGTRQKRPILSVRDDSAHL